MSLILSLTGDASPSSDLILSSFITFYISGDLKSYFDLAVNCFGEERDKFLPPEPSSSELLTESAYDLIFSFLIENLKLSVDLRVC